MSLNKKNVAAFVFLPQFHLCFQGISHLYPVFMRVLALMFTQAGILAHNHPATRFGIAGVKRYTVNELIGEAWYNLRNRRGATPYQWGVFASILLMMGAFLGALGNFLFTVAFGVGSVAHAQLFGNAVIPDTSIGFVQTLGPPPAGAVFDKRIGASAQNGGMAGYNDYALIMLDKILRSSAATPQTGGTLQNGITALFQVYNTAITVIAAVMIFWIILSIVVDTAKTGVVGGGRHNMVWAPIRIVFALGLMIPLGTVGYSSGQYCVMKLAEWGSNLGSNGWRAYVLAVTGVSDMLAPTSPENVSGVVNGMIASQVCRVAYNTYVEMSTGDTTATPGRTPDVNQLILPVNSISPDRQSLQRAWTNKSDGNLCGMLVIPMGADAIALGFRDDSSRIMAAINTAGKMFGNNNDYLATAEAARTAALAVVGANVVPALEPPALRFACAFVPHAMSAATPLAGWQMVTRARNATAPGYQQGINSWGGVTWNTGAAPAYGAAPVVTMGAMGSLCQGNNMANPCSTAITATSNKPNLSCHMAMNLLMSGTAGLVTQAINAAAAIFSTYLSGNSTNANSIMNSMIQRGWGGMGIWFNELASINLTHQALSAPNISVVPGKLASGSSKCQQGYQNGPTSCKIPLVDRETALVMSQYQAWYEKLATQAQVPIAAAALNLATAGLNGRYVGTGDIRQEQAEAVDKPSFPGMLEMAWWIGTGQSNKVMDAIIRRVFGLDNTRTYLWTNLVGDINDRTYPLVNMVVVGNKMLVSGGAILIGATVGQALVGLVPPGLGLAGSIIFDFAKMCAYTLMSTGMLLTLYVPVLPTIRVAFSVMTWMVSVFEATVMVPIACLAHLHTEGDGLAGTAKNCWILWLNVLVRPILTVFGFIGAFLVFNSWVVYFTNAFAASAMQSTSQSNVIIQILCQQFYSMMYVTICYSAANASFKMLDIIPNALFRWMPGASGDASFDSDGGAEGFTKETFAGLKGAASSAGGRIEKYGQETIDAAKAAAAKAGAAGA